MRIPRNAHAGSSSRKRKMSEKKAMLRQRLKERETRAEEPGCVTRQREMEVKWEERRKASIMHKPTSEPQRLSIGSEHDTSTYLVLSYFSSVTQCSDVSLPY